MRARLVGRTFAHGAVRYFRSVFGAPPSGVYAAETCTGERLRSGVAAMYFSLSFSFASFLFGCFRLGRPSADDAISNSSGLRAGGARFVGDVKAPFAGAWGSAGDIVRAEVVP